MDNKQSLHTAPDYGSHVKKLGYSVKEAVYASGLGRNSILKAIQNGKLKHLRFNRRIIIPIWALEEFLGKDNK